MILNLKLEYNEEFMTSEDKEMLIDLIGNFDFSSGDDTLPFIEGVINTGIINAHEQGALTHAELTKVE